MAAANSENGAGEAFLAGGGEMGALIRAHDWAHSSLGVPAAWPQALRTAVRVMLNTGHPMYIFWGPKAICLYNDAYSGSIGPERHPASLGGEGRAVWDEIWPIIGPQIIEVMSGGAATWHENALVPITRGGKLEDVYWTYSYGPIDDETAPNGVGGVLVVCAETTEQVIFAQQAAAERRRLADLMEQAPSFTAVLRGPTHIFDITNAAYRQLIGHRDVIGKPVREALPEIAGQGFFELLDEVYNSGKAFVGTGLHALIERQPEAPPEERFLDLIYQPITNSDGAVTGIFVQGHDVTDQKLAEIAAAASEERFRMLSQSLPNHIWTAQPDGNLDWFNDRVYAYSGARPGELDGQKWASIVHPDDVVAAAESWGQALNSAKPYSAEFRLRRHDGVYRWHIARAVPSVDANGKVGRWVGSNTDIDEQKSAEAALAESALQVRLALSAAEMGVWECKVVGGQFVDLVGDDRALALLGGSPVQSSSFDNFMGRIHPEDRISLGPAAAAALAPDGDGVLDIEYRVVPGAGNGHSEHWVHARAQAIRGPNGIRLIGTVRDVSQRKEAEARQAVLRGELQHRIKNTMAMVSAIATQTLRGDDIIDRRAAFTGRLTALAHATDILTASTWKSGQLRTVLDGALAAHGWDEHRFEASGPEVELNSRQALSLALALHELATNATKYGALSVDGGKVAIEWSLDQVNEAGEPVFKLVWTESGGPPVVEPQSKGFGSRLITRALAADFEGSVGIVYAPGGVVCTLISPRDRVVPEQSAHPALQSGEA
ncbi:MAG: PAS domain-containing protein [Devosia sp.]